MSDTPRTDAEAFWPHDSKEKVCDAVFARQLEGELNAANENTRRLHDCLETAWGIIANVSGGDWTRQKPEWQEAVIRWRDNQFDPIMKELSERRAKENK
jgi:hypothetical protein